MRGLTNSLVSIPFPLGIGACPCFPFFDGIACDHLEQNGAAILDFAQHAT